MAIKRYRPEYPGSIAFTFETKEEGRIALKMAVDLIAGECGDFTFLPPAGTDVVGYVGFEIRGDRNALSALTYPQITRFLMDGLEMSINDLLAILSPYLSENDWYKKAPGEPLTTR